jgi:hypothetical protein
MELNIMGLKKLVDLFEEKVDTKTKTTLASLGAVDKPQLGVDTYERAIDNLATMGGKSAICMVRVGDIYTDTTYNRGDNIHYTNIIKNMKKVGGFSYITSGTISLFVRPGGKLVTTQGNHRATMLYASCLDPNARIPATITLHDSNTEYNEIVRVEASNHNEDCNFRTAQSTDDRFRAAYHAGESWAENLHWFLDQFGIGVARTNPSAKYEATSYAKISESRKLDEYSCSRYLKAFTQVVNEKEVMGFATFSATHFLNGFRESIKYVDDNNNVDSVTGFLDYIYNHRHNRSHGYLNNVTQQKLSEGSNKIKGHEIGVARLITLYNEYCEKVISARIPKSNKHAIGYSSNEYKKFVDSTNADLRLRVGEIAQSRF